MLTPLLIAYAVVACAWWLWLLVGAIRVARAVPMLARVEPPTPDLRARARRPPHPVSVSATATPIMTGDDRHADGVSSGGGNGLPRASFSDTSGGPSSPQSMASVGSSQAMARSHSRA